MAIFWSTPHYIVVMRMYRSPVDPLQRSQGSVRLHKPDPPEECRETYTAGQHGCHISGIR